MLSIKSEHQILKLVNNQAAVIVLELAFLLNVTQSVVCFELQRMEALVCGYGSNVLAEYNAEVGSIAESKMHPGKSHDTTAVVIAPVNNRREYTLWEKRSPQFKGR